jgi:hypothetical protein
MMAAALPALLIELPEMVLLLIVAVAGLDAFPTMTLLRNPLPVLPAMLLLFSVSVAGLTEGLLEGTVLNTPLPELPVMALLLITIAPPRL